MSTPSQLLDASLDAPRRCMGRWVSGSGGHIMWSHDCPAPVEWVDIDDVDAFCDQHLPRVGGEIHPTFRGHVRRVEKAELDQQAVDLDELDRLVAEGPLDFAIEVQERRNILTRTIRYEPVVSDRDERLLNLLAKGLPKLLALARRALAPEAKGARIGVLQTRNAPTSDGPWGSPRIISTSVDASEVRIPWGPVEEVGGRYEGTDLAFQQTRDVEAVILDPSAPESDERHAPGMKRCPNCYDGGACLPGGCGAPDCTRCGKPCPTCGGSCEVSVDTKAAPTRARLYSTMRKALNDNLGRDSCHQVSPQFLQRAIEAVREYMFDAPESDDARLARLTRAFLEEHGVELHEALVNHDPEDTAAQLDGGFWRERLDALLALMKEFDIGK